MTEDGGGIWRKDKIIIFEYCGIYMPPMKDEINNVKIAVTCAATSSIVKTKQRHSGSKMNATAFCCSILNFTLHIEM